MSKAFAPPHASSEACEEEWVSLGRKRREERGEDSRRCTPVCTSRRTARDCCRGARYPPVKKGKGKTGRISNEEKEEKKMASTAYPALSLFVNDRMSAIRSLGRTEDRWARRKRGRKGAERGEGSLKEDGKTHSVLESSDGESGSGGGVETAVAKGEQRASAKRREELKGGRKESVRLLVPLRTGTRALDEVGESAARDGVGVAAVVCWSVVRGGGDGIEGPVSAASSLDS
jgi:hypothetical protein